MVKNNYINKRNKRIYTVLSPKTPIPIFKAPPPLSIPMDNNRINQPSIMRTVAEGFAFGTGSSIAREAVDREYSCN